MSKRSIPVSSESAAKKTKSGSKSTSDAAPANVRRSLVTMQQEYNDGNHQPLEDLVRAWIGIQVCFLFILELSLTSILFNGHILIYHPYFYCIFLLFYCRTFHTKTRDPFSPSEASTDCPLWTETDSTNWRTMSSTRTGEAGATTATCCSPRGIAPTCSR